MQHPSITPVVSPLVTKELLRIPHEAMEVHSEITAAFEQLELTNCSSCLDQEFKLRYFRAMDLFERYQELVVKHNKYTVSCKRGCSHCCNHWVEDVTSFEAEIIAEYIRMYYPDTIESIVAQCKEDVLLINNIEKLTVDKMQQCGDDESIDHIDLVLSVFYQMNKKCPLLSDSGSCSIYKVRPLTCRIYMSFSDTVLCAPEYNEQDEIPTYLLNLEESASVILDRLHFKYQRFADETGLRSLLLQHLVS